MCTPETVTETATSLISHLPDWGRYILLELLMTLTMAYRTAYLQIPTFRRRSSSTSLLLHPLRLCSSRENKHHATQTLLQQRSFHRTAILAKPPFAEDQKTLLQAFHTAKDAAFNKWKLVDGPDNLAAALVAAWKAHPFEQVPRKKHWDPNDPFKEMWPKGQWAPLRDIDDGLWTFQLKPDAPWGMVVYRASYDDDAAWERMLVEIFDTLVSSLESEDRLDLLSRHQLVVMDDRPQFEGATPDSVREHFNKWVQEELKRNWRVPPMPDDEVAKVKAANQGIDRSLGVRYNFCLLVDDICLESLDRRPPILKLVDKRERGFDEYEMESLESEEILAWEGGVTNSEFEDVGWMYQCAAEYVEHQNRLGESDNWSDEYQRPPMMDWDFDFSHAPGYWRRNGKSSKKE